MARYVARSERFHTIMLWCPACDRMHYVDPRTWAVSGEGQKFTVSPSILTWATANSPRCHAFLTEGVWRYLGDCTHQYSDTTMAMVEIPEGKDKNEMYEAVFDV